MVDGGRQRATWMSVSTSDGFTLHRGNKFKDIGPVYCSFNFTADFLKS